MVNTKDEIKSGKLSNIGHTIALIRDANEVSDSLIGDDYRRVTRVIDALIRDLEKQVKAMND